MTVLMSLDRLTPNGGQHSDSLKLAQLMRYRHTCPCCSNPLLRHIHLGKLYWRCNHCYQAMPVIEDAQKLPLFVTHEKSGQPVLIAMPL